MPGKYVPINPAAISTTKPCPNVSGHENPVLSATVGTNAELFAEVAKLWIKPDDIIVDGTYGRGVFWKNLPDFNVHAHDIMWGDDLRDLPYEDNSVDVVVLDPPYRPSHGSKSFSTSGNGLSEAYKLGESNLDSINDVTALYRSGLKEAYRIIRVGGRVIVKCQDLSYGHRLHLVSLDILNHMIDSGFELADQFLLVNNSRLTSSKWTSQERARRNHSILWIGLKEKSSAPSAIRTHNQEF